MAARSAAILMVFATSNRQTGTKTRGSGYNCRALAAIPFPVTRPICALTSESHLEVRIARSPQGFVRRSPRFPTVVTGPGDVLPGLLRLRGKNRSLNPNRWVYPVGQGIDRR